MAAAAAATAAPVRQSCDRCHGQKLRCERSGDGDTGACIRCIRQGSQCVYSSSLPKGRPNLHRQAVNADRSGVAKGQPSPAKRRAGAAAAPEPQRRRAASGQRIEVAGGPASTAGTGAPASSAVPAAAPAPAHALSRSDRSTDIGIDVPPLTAMSTSTEPFSALDTFDWSDLEMDGSEHMPDLGTWTPPGLPLPSPPFQPHALSDAFPDGRTFFASGFPTASTFIGGGRVDLPPGMITPTSTHVAQELGLGKGPERPGPAPGNHSGATNHGSGFPDAKDVDELGAAITQLTQLCTCLNPLYGASQALADAQEPPARASLDRPAGGPEILFDGELFQSLIASFHGAHDLPAGLERPCPSTVAGTLQSALGASRRLLQILHSLDGAHRRDSASPQGEPLPPVPDYITPPASVHRGSASSSSGGGALPRPGNTPPTEGPSSTGASATRPAPAVANPCAHPVVRHLVLACHSGLLAVYAAALGALQANAEQVAGPSSAAGPNHAPMACNNGAAYNGGSNGALGDMWLSLAVQLCAYLVQRQRHAVYAYWGVAADAPPAPAGPCELEACVEERLKRLRQTLRL